MVVLVRCIDNTCSLALESRLNELINEGLIAAFLQEGTWVKADRMHEHHDYATTFRPARRLTAMVSSF